MFYCICLRLIGFAITEKAKAVPHLHLEHFRKNHHGPQQEWATPVEDGMG